MLTSTCSRRTPESRALPCTRSNPNAHAERGGLEMLDREPGPHGGFARIELWGNRANRRRFEPVAEHGGGQDSDPFVFEPVGGMLGTDHLFEAANLTHAHLPHAP